MASVWQELKRRNVVRVGIGYAIVAWLLLQVADVVLNNISAPSWVFQTVLLLLVLGFPLALFFAWAFELTPDGLKKEKDVDRSESITQITGRRLDFLIIVVLSIALAMFALDKFVWSVGDSAETTTTTQTRTIAVLPFENFSEDPENEYFADGISEEILNLLAGIPELRVTSRSSAFSFKGQNLDIPTIAARLNVAHVLEGSVRRWENKLRVTAQLIEADSDTHLWSDTFERDFDNIFAIQDEIAAAVADAMQITLLGRALKTKETNPEAYSQYLQARHFLDIGSLDGTRQAERAVNRALEIDPEYAPAWITLGWTYLQQANQFGLRTFDDAQDLALQAFQRARTIDPDDGRPYGGLAFIELAFDRDFDAASDYLQAGLELNPGNPDLLGTLATLHMTLGQVDEAIRLTRVTIARDPLSGHGALGLYLYFAGRWDEATDAFQLDRSLNPDGVWVQYMLGKVLVAQGSAEAALAIIREQPDEGWRLMGTTVAEYSLGNISASDTALSELVEKYSADMAYQIAIAYSVRGDSDSAFEWLDRAYENRDSGLQTLLVEPLLANLRDDSRWVPFLEKMNLPH